jgi:hypothetical protein
MWDATRTVWEKDWAIVCIKCRHISGDDWIQCGNECPMPHSPVYNPDPEYLRRCEEEFLPKYIQNISDAQDYWFREKVNAVSQDLKELVRLKQKYGENP